MNTLFPILYSPNFEKVERGWDGVGEGHIAFVLFVHSLLFCHILHCVQNISESI